MDRSRFSVKWQSFSHFSVPSSQFVSRRRRVVTKNNTRILILGGGFAGLHAAIHLDDTLARDPDVEITLVNRDNFFLFKPHASRGRSQ